jgi:2-iminobutanoate/2-iminopropanoate deaminase
VKLDGLLFVSGNIPVDPATGGIVPGGIEAQTEQVLKNLRAVVEASDSELGKVVKTTVRVTLVSGECVQADCLLNRYS